MYRSGNTNAENEHAVPHRKPQLTLWACPMAKTMLLKPAVQELLWRLLKTIHIKSSPCKQERWAS